MLTGWLDTYAKAKLLTRSGTKMKKEWPEMAESQ